MDKFLDGGDAGICAPKTIGDNPGLALCHPPTNGIITYKTSSENIGNGTIKKSASTV